VSPWVLAAGAFGPTILLARRLALDAAAGAGGGAGMAGRAFQIVPFSA